MNDEIKFRAKRVDNGEWVFGDLNQRPIHYPRQIIENGVILYSVVPETVGQLRYKKNGIEYYDGDIFYCAGYGLDVVSDLCQIHDRVSSGDSGDIEEVMGNIHDTPELLYDESRET